MPNIPLPQYRLTHLNKIVYEVSFFLPVGTPHTMFHDLNILFHFFVKCFIFLSFKGLTRVYLNFQKSFEI